MPIPAEQAGPLTERRPFTISGIKIYIALIEIEPGIRSVWGPFPSVDAARSWGRRQELLIMDVFELLDPEER